MRNKTALTNSNGFSLIELIIVIFLAGAILLVIANIPQVIRLVTGTKYESIVREVTAKKIEDVRLTGYDNIANGTTSISDPRLNSLPNLAGTALIEDCPLSICTNGELAKQVTITFTWSDNSEPKRFSVVTLVSKGGLR